jgi:hypothetical protein
LDKTFYAKPAETLNIFEAFESSILEILNMGKIAGPLKLSLPCSVLGSDRRKAGSEKTDNRRPLPKRKSLLQPQNQSYLIELNGGTKYQEQASLSIIPTFEDRFADNLDQSQGKGKGKKLPHPKTKPKSKVILKGKNWR